MHNKVYNVTNFLFDHPGGPSVLTDLAGALIVCVRCVFTFVFGRFFALFCCGAGKDATKDFEALHSHSADAKDTMKQFYVGDLAPEVCLSLCLSVCFVSVCFCLSLCLVHIVCTGTHAGVSTWRCSSAR